jgi:hypothetical protein
VLHSRKSFFKKNPVDGVKSSPSATVALGQAFPECTIFGTRGRALPREPLPRKPFPECCTRGRLPRVLLPLPRVPRARVHAVGRGWAGTRERQRLTLLFASVAPPAGRSSSPPPRAEDSWLAHLSGSNSFRRRRRRSWGTKLKLNFFCCDKQHWEKNVMLC